MSTVSSTQRNIFTDNSFNESEQDANSMLTELDKGLRSTKLGIQCEAIVRFPRLFEKYPFPILVNSSFLKLSEFFINGSNLLRFWVLRVCQQSENHLDKILNIDAFVKRIFMVMHSNDPVARSITLLTLGAVARVIAEKQQVHHAIRRALDSHNTVEVNAAISASSLFAEQSRSFAISMCTKFSDMIESLAIPVPMKLRLIPVLRHMHHDANTASVVEELCLNLLRKYPAERFVVAILDSLTELASRTLTGVPHQVNLLLRFITDPRIAVRRQALKSLNTLAGAQCVHAWPKSAINDFINNARLCDDENEQAVFLKVILSLSKSPLICHSLFYEHKLVIVKYCLTCICMNNYSTAAKAMAILAALTSYRGIDSERINTEIVDIAKLHFEGLILGMIDDKENSKNLHHILTSAVQIARFNTEFNTEFIAFLMDLLTNEFDYPKSNVELMCNALGGLCSHCLMHKYTQQNAEQAMNTSSNDDIVPITKETNPVLQRLPMIMHKLKLILSGENITEEEHTIEILAAIALQSMIGCFAPLEVIECLEQCCERTNHWTQLRIARSASRYGQHYLAALIHTKLWKNVTLDKFYFYLMALSQMSNAECILTYGYDYQYMQKNYKECDPNLEESGTNKNDSKSISLINRLDPAINLYMEAQASLRASSSTTYPLTFQLEYFVQRAHFLQTLRMAVIVKNAQTIVPPPAIAGTLAQNSRDYLQKFGHVTNQLRKLVKTLKNCEESYSRFYMSAFDADPATLEFLEIAEYQCALFASIVETICYATPPEPPSFLTIGNYPETRYFIYSCRKMEELRQTLPEQPTNAKTISNRHLELILSLVETVVKTPICIPRFFYQSLQSTQIKLSVSPQPRTAGEPVIVQSGSNLVIKIEGVVQHYAKKRSQFRRVDSVQITLTSQLLTARAPSNDITQKPISDTVTLTQSVKPQRDFLSCSFLLPISNGGQWQVMLETYITDENDITWCTGPKNSMIVRVLDDPAKATSTPPQASTTRRF